MTKVIVVDCSFCSRQNCPDRDRIAKDNCIYQWMHDGKSKISKT